MITSTAAGSAEIMQAQRIVRWVREGEGGGGGGLCLAWPRRWRSTRSQWRCHYMHSHIRTCTFRRHACLRLRCTRLQRQRLAGSCMNWWAAGGHKTANRPSSTKPTARAGAGVGTDDHGPVSPGGDQRAGVGVAVHGAVHHPDSRNAPRQAHHDAVCWDPESLQAAPPTRWRQCTAV